MFDPKHVHNRHALGDANDELDTRIDRLDYRLGGKGRRHKDKRGVRPGGAGGLFDGVEYRHLIHLLAAFAGRYSGHHGGAVSNALASMELPFFAGNALNEYPGCVVSEDCHLVSP